jgi:HEAT repeat protein
MRYATVVKHFEKIGAEGVPILVELLDKSERKEVRAFAALVLAKIGEEGRAAIPALVRCLAWRNDVTASQAADALAKHGAEAGDALLDAVRSPDHRLMLQAGEVLVEMGIRKEALAELLLTRLREGEGETRVVAAWLLGRLTGPDHRLVDRKKNRLSSLHREPWLKPPPAAAPQVRAMIAAALTDHPDAGVRLAAIESLRHSKTDAAEADFTTRGLARDPDERVRRIAKRVARDVWEAAEREQDGEKD